MSVPIALRPVDNSDLGLLRRFEFAVLGSRWRSRAFTVSPEEFAARLFSGTAQQLIGESSLGVHCWLQAYNFDFAAEHCEIAVARLDPERLDNRPAVRCFLRFVDQLFSNWNLSKIYMEVPEYNLQYVESLVGTEGQIEGRRLDYLHLDGRKWDVLTIAIWREPWAASTRYSEMRSGQ